MILLEKEMPNGGMGRYHVAAKMELRPDGIHVIVNSFHKPEMAMVTWQDTYLLPPPFSAENLDQVEGLLVHAGAPFAGGSLVSLYITTIEEAKAKKWADVKSTRNFKEQNIPAVTQFGPVQADDSSKIKISSLVTLAQLQGPEFSENFTLADNSTLILNEDNVKELAVEVAGYVSRLHAHAQTLRAQIEDPALDSIPEIQEIDILNNWPT